MFNQINNLDQITFLLTPQKRQLAYANYLSSLLQAKLIETVIHKSQFQNLVKDKRKYRSCVLDCLGPAFRQGVLEEMRQCKETCKEDLRKVERFLDRINYLSQKKFTNCSGGCRGEQGFQRKSCLWGCYNKLDKRYREYWLKQKQQL